MRVQAGAALVVAAALSIGGCGVDDDADVPSLPEPSDGTGVVDVGGERLEFVIDRCALEPTSIDPEDVPPGGHVPAVEVDVLMELVGTGRTSSGEPVAVEVQALSGGLAPEIGNTVTVAIGARLDPVRSWEAFRAYDPDSGEATTFSGQPAPDGPLIEVDDRAVRVEGDFALREGFTLTDDLIAGALVAVCRRSA